MEKQVPEFFKEMLLKQYGEQLTNQILEGYSKQRVVTLRVNTIKYNSQDLIKYFKVFQFYF